VTCPLCKASDTLLFHNDKSREYYQCQECFLVYTSTDFYLSSVDEKKRYNLHQNSDETEGYRKYLEKVSLPVMQRFDIDHKGLDFGCGPGPLLYEMFVEAGYAMQKYDVFYEPNLEVLKQQYDFITMTEVIEHLHKPSQVLKQLFDMLAKKGSLVVMTNLYTDKAGFTSWWYKNDLTHVCFFHTKSLEWIAQKFEADLEYLSKEVFIFTKS